MKKPLFFGGLIALSMMFSLSLFAGGKAIVSVPKYQEERVLENFPLPVRISESLIDGFKYSDCKGGAIAFTDKAGNALPFEIDTWCEDGESLVWVGLTLEKGAEYVFSWGKAAKGNDPTKVWKNFYAVLHLNSLEDGCYHDSTGNGHDGAPYYMNLIESGVTKTFEGGPIGGRYLQNWTIGEGIKDVVFSSGGMKLLNTKKADIKGKISFSAWTRLRNNGQYGRFFSSGHAFYDGFNLTLNGGGAKSGAFFMGEKYHLGKGGIAETNDSVPFMNVSEQDELWRYLSVSLFGGNGVSFYCGVRAFENGEIWARFQHDRFTVKTADYFSLGAFCDNDGSAPYIGDIDEFRIYKLGDMPTDTWQRTDYAAQTEKGYVVVTTIH